MGGRSQTPAHHPGEGRGLVGAGESPPAAPASAGATGLSSEDLDALPADEIARRLAAPPEERAAFVRAAAAAGVAEAQAVYGQMLLDGAGVGKDARAAVGWFWKAATQGHAMAINMIGRCYDLGWGVGVDKARAAEWYRVAADKGLDWAMYNLATLMALGEGVAEDRPGALALFRQAADLTGNPKALNFIGSFHEDGWVVARDMGEAARLYALAAEGGDFRGMFNHARMLIDAGRAGEAQGWIERLWPIATEAFREKVAGWLRKRSLKVLLPPS